MTASALLRAAARRELDIARASLDLIDRQILSRLGAPAAARGVLTHIRDTLGELVEHTDDDSTGGGPRTASPTVDVARNNTPADHAGSAVLTQTELETAGDLADSYLADEEDHLVGELADDDELRRVQAQLRAKHTLQESDEQRPSES